MSPLKPFRSSRLVFGSYFAYLPPRRGGGELARQSQNLTYALKQDAAWGTTGRTISQEIARRLEDAVPGSVLEVVLGGDAVLVPVPRSGGALWPSLRIAEALAAHGFGERVAPLVTRLYGVRSSAAVAGDRRLWPDQHYDSMQVDRTLGDARGSTMLGATGRLAESFAGVEIAGSQSFAPWRPGRAFEKITDPCVGEINWRPGWISREP